LASVPCFLAYLYAFLDFYNRNRFIGREFEPRKPSPKYASDSTSCHVNTREPGNQDRC